MKPEKAYIIRTNHKKSLIYADLAAKTCLKVGLDYEFFEGYVPTSELDLWKQHPLNIKKYKPFELYDGTGTKASTQSNLAAAGCTASHLHVWDLIRSRKEAAIILEHDAIMLHPLDLDIPDDRIVTLGYKFPDIENYDCGNTSPPSTLVDVSYHPGAHAYSINHIMANRLISEIEYYGVRNAIDDMYFEPWRSRYTEVKLSITDPICAVGWLRDSTIWSSSAIQNNRREMLKSFKDNYKGIQI